jgi:hypothetical protein
MVKCFWKIVWSAAALLPLFHFGAGRSTLPHSHRLHTFQAMNPGRTLLPDFTKRKTCKIEEM